MRRERDGRSPWVRRVVALLAVVVAIVLIVRSRPAPPTATPEGTEPPPPVLTIPGGAHAPPLSTSCEAHDQDPLFAFARQQWGAPTGCERRIEHAHGADWPTDTWAFRDGVTLTYQQSPPESFSAVLAAPAGFDAAAARTLVAGVAADWREGGFHVDVAAAPEVEPEGERQRETWADPEEGLNARISLVTQGDRAYEVRRSAAL
jgi:hypothetical protein